MIPGWHHTQITMMISRFGRFSCSDPFRKRDTVYEAARILNEAAEKEPAGTKPGRFFCKRGQRPGTGGKAAFSGRCCACSLNVTWYSVPGMRCAE